MIDDELFAGLMAYYGTKKKFSVIKKKCVSWSFMESTSSLFD